MHVQEIPVSAIYAGNRRREDYGDIGGLANGIKRVGLLEPIIVDRTDEGYRLVAGGRRLRAVMMLGWDKIPASLLDQLTDEELRDIELEENDNRKSLTEQERERTFAASKKIVEKAKQAEAILAHSGPEKTGKRGQPAKPDSTRAVAKALGTSRQSIERAEQHVATVEQFPAMKGWRQSEVLRVNEHLSEMPAEDQKQTADVLACATLLDPDSAVKMVKTIASKKPEERKEIFKLAKSSDPREKSLALTKSVELPPMPDPRLAVLNEVQTLLGKVIKPYPSDPLTPELTAIRSQIAAVRNKVKAVSYDARELKKASVQ